MTKSNWEHSIACMGDSLTHNVTLSVPLHLLYPGQLQMKLRDTGAYVVVRNFGKSGNTTAQMLSRFACMTQFSIPDIGIIFGGVNDASAAVPLATTQANIESMITNLQNAGVKNILVVSTQYLNFSTGGDTLSTPYVPYADIRNVQQEAANTHGVVFVDLFNFMRNRIVNGTDTQGSYSWHVADGNQHFNSYGCGIVADCVFEAIRNQGWVDSLR
jgi:lysophospholipase L1-like esterase